MKFWFHWRTTPFSTLSALFLQSRGAIVIESRGIDTTIADWRSADRCTMRLVSERLPSMPYSVCPLPRLVPSRLSEPITKMLSGARLVCASVVASCSRPVAQRAADVEPLDVAVELDVGRDAEDQGHHEQPATPKAAAAQPGVAVGLARVAVGPTPVGRRLLLRAVGGGTRALAGDVVAGRRAVGGLAHVYLSDSENATPAGGRATNRLRECTGAS